MTNDSSASIVSKVWNYARVLKNAGVGYGDYVEQITYLLFLKLADEMAELGFDNTDCLNCVGISTDPVTYQRQVRLCCVWRGNWINRTDT